MNKPKQIYEMLLANYGEQSWWPADSKDEIIIGAILTQNTNWTNVEKSISKLKENGFCNLPGIKKLEKDELAKLIYSSGYYNQKAERLLDISSKLTDEEKIKNLSILELRNFLLSLKGIGPETADSILLYAYEKPIFVVDLYTKRIFSRLGILPFNKSYGEYQKYFMDNLPNEAKLFQEYHALILSFAKQYCQKKPKCEICFLKNICNYEREK